MRALLFTLPQRENLLARSSLFRLDRRDLVWINVTTSPTAEWIARQLTEAFPWDAAPSRDREGGQSQGHCRAMATLVDLRHKMHKFMYIGESREKETPFRIAAGETGRFAGAEGAPAPETLRQKNRAVLD